MTAQSDSMMHNQLTTTALVEHAGKYHGDTEIVSVETDGGLRTGSWSEVRDNAKRLASALEGLGLEQGDRCATIAWNNQRHLEIYFGVSGGGHICHTINPRLFPEQIVYIVNHAEDQILFVDKTFLPILVDLEDQLPTVKAIVLLSGHDGEATGMLDGILFYDELLKNANAGYLWPSLDENTASSLCYTSGTTGAPKGVLYTHRTTVIHSMGGNQPDGLAIHAREVVLPVVPMFHVNAWGVPYIAAMAGCKLVLPGPGLDGPSLVQLIDGQKVTLALGVPTIWMGLLAALAESGSKAESLKRTVVGGSALPPSMIPKFRDAYGVELIHAWGMTETSPMGTLNQLLKKHEDMSADEQSLVRLGQGRPMFGVDIRIVDDENTVLPNDGETQGNLQIQGYWVVHTYFKQSGPALTADGWFDTGDVATIDPDGYMVIRDRSKDIIKSGGEWISTVELENIAIGHIEIVNAAVIAARHEKWGERPLLIAIKALDSNLDEQSLLAFYDGKVAKWQMPDRAIFVDELPIGGTGKILKNRLRETYGNVLLETG